MLISWYKWIFSSVNFLNLMHLSFYKFFGLYKVKEIRKSQNFKCGFHGFNRNISTSFQRLHQLSVGFNFRSRDDHKSSDHFNVENDGGRFRPLSQYGRRNGANSTNQNHYQHQQPICSSTFFFYINNKIRPTSTINTIINIRNMPNSTTRENQHQQKFLFSSTTICLTTNIGHRLQQQNKFNNLGTNDWLWSREVGTQKF